MFDLIVCTIGRPESLAALFDSLEPQTTFIHQIFVVDQSDDRQVSDLIARYDATLPVVRIESNRGLSMGRNAALARVSAPWVAFPDDDCVYPPDLLQYVASMIAHHPEVDGFSGSTRSLSGNAQTGRFDVTPGPIGPGNVWTRAISFTLFVRGSVARAIRFDDTLGVGAGTPWGAGEETDFVLRALASGASFRFEPSLVVFHPPTGQPLDAGQDRRALAYGRGLGRVMRLHGYPLRMTLPYLVRPLAGLALMLLRGKVQGVRFYAASLRGRLSGLTSRVDNRDG